MSVSEFMKGMPSFNEDNFSRFHGDGTIRPCFKRPSVYIPTKDFPSDQVIVTEKTNILLRFLHQQWEKKGQNKRDQSSIDGEDAPQRKRARSQSASKGQLGME